MNLKAWEETFRNWEGSMKIVSMFAKSKVDEVPLEVCHRSLAKRRTSQQSAEHFVEVSCAHLPSRCRTRSCNSHPVLYPAGSNKRMGEHDRIFVFRGRRFVAEQSIWAEHVLRYGVEKNIRLVRF